MRTSELTGAFARRLGAVALLSIATALPASAQSGRHIFAGVGGVLLDDQAPRLVLGGLDSGSSSVALIVDGGLFITPRVAIGVELIKPPATETSTSGHFGTISTAEHEVTISGTVHVTALRADRLSLDVVGGLGIIRGSYDTDSTINNAPFPPVTSVTSEKRSGAAFLSGVNVLVFPTRHLAIGPIARLYWLRPEERTPSFPGDTVPLLDRPTHRWIVGGLARLFW